MLYVITGHLHWQAPRQLPLWWVDEVIPFISWTVWLYFSQYALLLAGFCSVEATRNLTRLIYGLTLASLCGFLIFTLCPIVFPRVNYEFNGGNAFLFQFLYSIDTPANCFPSLHVALAWLTVFAMVAERPHRRLPVFMWAGLISISTMTTKQHYFADVLGGLALAAFCQTLIGRLFSERHTYATTQ